MKKYSSLKVGIIGVGNMGKHHARVYNELGVNIVGMADTNVERAEEIAYLYGTKSYTHYEALLNQELDAVSIAVPTIEHKAVALAAIRHGTNILIEKPIADSVRNGQEIIDAAGEKRVKLMVGHIERFNPAVQKLKKVINEGVLGELILISVRRVGPFVSRITDTGIIVDTATHDIDVCRYLVGKEYTSVFARSTRYKNNKGDAALILVEFDNVFSSIEVNWYTPHRVRNLTVTGTEGIAYLDYIKQEIEIYTTQDTIFLNAEREEPLRLELVHFLDCLISGEQPMVTGYDALKALEIACKAEKISLGKLGNIYEPEK
ncbi:Gfo/Idh/MocA family oxidoreductase [Chloroflexota bacterium]